MSKGFKLVIALICGLMSGVVSYFTSSLFDSPTQLFFLPKGLLYIPGFVFAITFLIYGYLFESIKLSVIRSFLWLILCSASYYIAVYICILISTLTGLANGIDVAAFLLAGIIGSTGMVTSFNFCIKEISFTSFLLLIVIGGILGLSPFLDKLIGWDGLLILFVLWQSIMMVGLEYS